MWSPEGDLIVRSKAISDGVGGWKFERIDRATGTRASAFNHELARDLLGASGTGDVLPRAQVFVEGGKLYLQAEARKFRMKPDGALEEIPLEDTSSGRLVFLRPTRKRRSTDAGGATTVLFQNRTARAITLQWIDREGEKHRYATVAAGEDYTQGTYGGHLWSVENPDGTEIARFVARNTPCVASIDANTVTPESNPEETSRNPGQSPDGRWLALIRDHDVWLLDVTTTETTRVTHNGKEDDRFLARFRWSPDSTHLATIREVPAETREVHLIESAPRDQLQPKLHTIEYAKPGDRIAAPRPVIISVADGKGTPVDTTEFRNPWSITELAWSADGSEFTFLVDLRGHSAARWIAARPDGTTRVIIDETSETFVDYASKRFLRTIREGREALWMSERSGWNHLWRIDVATGLVLGSVTGGEWLVRGVETVDDASETVVFRALGVFPGQDPYHVHFGRVGFDGTGLTWLTEGDGTHSIEFSPDGTSYLDSYSRVDLPPVHEWRRRADGSLIARVASTDISILDTLGWKPPERFVAKGRDGETDIWGAIFCPSNFDPKKRYPVIEQIYAGPHGHFVTKKFGAWHSPRALAELGFIVVQIDGMGTNWRSKAFHDVAWKNLGDSGFPDRIAWLRAAAKTRPWLDLERVGIYGGSAGWQSALRALLAHGDFYDVAVSDCGCHDNRIDKIWWYELWMGWPLGPHYAEQSNVTQAQQLEGKLLLIVGEIDRNVDPASTMQVVDALVRADKDFDLLVIPGAGHGAGGTPYGRRRTHDFFVRHLLGVEPRRVAP